MPAASALVATRLLLALMAAALIALPQLALAAAGDVFAVRKVSNTQGNFPAGLGASDIFGYALDGLGDVNGDGINDIVAGVPGDDDGASGAGAVYVLFMAATGTVDSFEKISATSGLFAGPLAAGDAFGQRVAGIGDLDLDGVPDLAVGASFKDAAGTDEGGIWILFLNANGTVKSEVLLTSATNGFPFIPSNTGLSSVAPLGDMDGDGVVDLVVGASFADVGATNAGSVWVLFMNPNGTVKSSQQIASGVGGFGFPLSGSDYFGFSVEGLGDIDGDGVPDMAVGAYGEDTAGLNAGTIFVIRLNANGTVKSDQAITDGLGGFTAALSSSDNFGASLTRLGDLDGDGTVDLGVGAPGDDDGGASRGAFYQLFLTGTGTVTATVKVSSSTPAFGGFLDDGDSVGVGLGSAGDLDGDGIIEILAGAPSDDDGAASAGAFYVAFMDGAGEVCGNLVLDPSEQCDDGNTTPLDGCSATCQLEYYDYQVEAFGPTNLTPWFDYEVGVDTVSTTVLLDVSLEETQSPVDFDARFELVAYTSGGVPWAGGGVGDPSEVFLLSTENVGSDHVDLRPSYPGAASGPFEVTYELSGRLNGDGSGESFESWRIAHAKLGNHYRFHVVLDPDDSFPEFPPLAELNNEDTTLSEWNSLPLTGDVYFGTVAAQIVLGSSSMAPFGCAPGEVNLLVLTYDWNPSPNDQWTHGVVTESPVAPACNPLVDPGGDVGFDLDASFSSIVPSVTSTFDGLNVEVVNTGMGPGGVTPGLVTIDLPFDVTFHEAEPNDATRPHPHGRVQIANQTADQASIADFADLTVTISGGFLQAGAVPLSFGVGSLTFAQSQVVGDYSSVFYRYDLEFFSGDRRNKDGANALQTNDRRFGSPESIALQTNTLFSLNAQGMNTQADFQASSGQTHYPAVSVTWVDFSAALDGTELADQTLPQTDQYVLKQLTPCPGCEAGGPDAIVSYHMNPSASQGLGADGTVLAVMQKLSNDPAWGPAPNDAQLGTKTYQRVGDNSFEGVLALPGFLAEGTGLAQNRPVVEYLMGMRVAEDDGGVPMPGPHYPLTHPQARKGNHFMAGMNMGPEIYSTGQFNQPMETSFGDFLTLGLPENKTIIQLPGLNLSSIAQPIVNNLGTKYVLRRGGVVGVFNTDVVPDPMIYGYDFDFERWAFRLLAVNELDTYTWLDGTVSVDKPGLFDIAFTSLELMCTGDLGGGHVVKGDCENDPEDVNCAETLHAWRTDFDLLTMNFVPDPPPANMCLADDRVMEVGSVVYPQALEEPLGMVAQWYPDGTPGSADFTGQSDRYMDRPADQSTPAEEDIGFDLALDKGVALEHIGDEQGWWEVTGTLGLPFWESLDVRTRLENASLTSRKQTVVVDGSYSFPPATDHASAVGLMENEAATYPSSVYTWGATGWSIDENDLNIRYEPGHAPGGQLSSLMPRFVGVTESFNAVVLDMDAGTDFVTPETTKVSFGASANFDLNVDIHIDVSDPNSVAEIDQFLANFGLPQNLIGNLLYNGPNSFMNRMNFMNDILSAGLSEAMRLAIEAAIPTGNGPLQDVASSLEALRSIPAQAAGGITSELDKVLNELPAPLSPELDAVVTDIYNDLPPVLIIAAAGGPLTAQDQALLVQVSTDIQDVVIPGLTAFEAGLLDAKGTASGLSGNFGAVLDSSTTKINDATGALTSLVDFLNGTALAQTGANNPVVDKINETTQAISDVRQAVQAVPIQQFSSLISTVSDVNIDGVAGAQRDILEVLEEMEMRLNEANAAIQTVIGGPSGMLADLTDPVTGILPVLSNDLSGSVLPALLGLEASLDGAMKNVEDELDAAKLNAEKARIFMEGLKDQADAALFADPTMHPFNYSGEASAAAIQSRMNTEFMSETGFDFFSSGSFVNDMNANAINGVNAAVGAVVGQVNTALGPVSAAVHKANPNELRNMLVNTIMNSPAVEQVNNIANQHLAELGFDMNNASMLLLDQFNFLLKGVFEEIEGAINEALAAATSAIPDWGFSGAGLDGFALISGNELERLHVEASFSQDSDSDEGDMTYGAALDVTSWSANGKAEACGVADPESRLDAIISVMNIPIDIGAADIMLKKLYVGFTMVGNYPSPPVPEAFFGGVITEGDISFEAFTIYDVQFHAGVGNLMGYAGARAGATFDSIQMEVAFLLGLTCDPTILQQLDPQAAEFIDATAFNGAFVRGSASIPIYNVGCLLTIGASADAGMWVIAPFPGAPNPDPLTVGGIVGGGVYGKGGCIVSIKGQITTFMQVKGGDFEFQGEGFVVGGFGFDCDPETWKDVPKSRKDDWCATGDASFKATYKGSWNVGAPSFSAIH